MIKISLKDLKTGETARIVKLKSEHSLTHLGNNPLNNNQLNNRSYRQKLLAMGFVPGALITIGHIPLLGDPVEIKIDKTSIAIRKHEAECLVLERA